MLVSFQNIMAQEGHNLCKAAWAGAFAVAAGTASGVISGVANQSLVYGVVIGIGNACIAGKGIGALYPEEENQQDETAQLVNEIARGVSVVASAAIVGTVTVSVQALVQGALWG